VLDGFARAAEAARDPLRKIEILPAPTATVRTNCGGEADLVDWNNSVWSGEHGVE
jgi:hypothetical protein